MKDGFYLPTRGPLAEPDAIAAIVRGGESLGYATIVVGDHIVFPVFVESKYPYTIDGGFPGHGDALEQLSLMAFVVGITEHARLVTSVMILQPHVGTSTRPSPGFFSASSEAHLKPQPSSSLLHHHRRMC